MDAQVTHFQALFESYNDAIFRHLYFRLGNRERAKELTQEVFLRLWKHMQTDTTTIVHEKAFLYKIAHNLFINEIRTDKTTYSLDELMSDTSFDVVDTAVSPDTSAEHAELLRYLDTLQDTYREVLVMRYIDGLQVKEIAEALDEKETNISMRIARAIEKLKGIYDTRN